MTWTWGHGHLNDKSQVSKHYSHAVSHYSHAVSHYSHAVSQYLASLHTTTIMSTACTKHAMFHRLILQTPSSQHIKCVRCNQTQVQQACWTCLLDCSLVAPDALFVSSPPVCELLLIHYPGSLHYACKHRASGCFRHKHSCWTCIVCLVTNWVT